MIRGKVEKVLYCVSIYLAYSVKLMMSIFYYLKFSNCNFSHIQHKNKLNTGGHGSGCSDAGGSGKTEKVGSIKVQCIFITYYLDYLTYILPEVSFQLWPNFHTLWKQIGDHMALRSNAALPPLSVFTNFVHNEVMAWNAPGMTLHQTQVAPTKHDNEPQKKN